MVPLLMTRPLAAAERFVAGLPEAARAGLKVVYAPLMEIQAAQAPVRLEGVKGVIFTSANGVEAASRETAARLPAYCVGERTAQAAAESGWTASCLGHCAGELVAALLSRRPEAPLLHLRGAHARGGISGRLTDGGIPCREQILYDQVLLPLTSEARALLAAQTDVIVPLFSPRTAHHFADLCGEAAHLHLIALSPAVAEPLKGLNCKTLRVSKSPDAAAVAAAVLDAAAQLSQLEGERRAE
ncbi:uroporphyrinogen-III synthase [Leisingera aquaemixtae]|uniref:Uroporphyrinogen-III synthase n=2 Tax=Leisingera aquaemixtae TaxID=1396826 RepID=A0A0P1HCM3_9RHOB|nr:uroporphyrinogen-III synthase [Leisingera aquaemixtae]CUI01385.1 uroporphyrinogen-III synthase [Leisingera aquaemixtae]